MLCFAMSGKMRSGKDSAADYIEHRLMSFGLQVKRLAFAETLKRIATYAQQEAGVPQIKDRELLQFIGVHFREINPEVWVDAVKRQIMEVVKEGETDAILITDLRFQNEYEMLDNLGFTLIRTHASDDVRAGRGAEVAAMQHISEIALDYLDRTPGSWDWFITNESTLDEFYKVLELVIAKAQLEDQEF